MSGNYSEDPIAVAEQAERDLNTYEAKSGRSKDVSDSSKYALMLSPFRIVACCM